MSYVSGKTIRKQYGVSASTLRLWANTGKVDTLRTPGKTRLYSKSGIARALGVILQPCQEKKNFIYARVSSAGQRDDLERQASALRAAYPDYELVSDIGSGLNWARKGLKAILGCVFRQEVGEVVVADRDRLARVAVELLEWILETNGAKLIVHRNVVHEQDTDELRDDLLAIVTHFVARKN